MNNLTDKTEPYASLNYSDPTLLRQDRERGRRPPRWKQHVRRACMGAGLSLILLGYAELQYRGPAAEEVFFCWGVGGLLFGAAIPAARPRRTTGR